ncbi:MAG: 50S ribosomal protein L16 [Patescibacteria group bacterium]|nr:50S ribosomal protein L16 [Patescibacteria group bacterium]
MLLPKKVKYRKQQRGSMKGVATGTNQIAFGKYGLKSLDRTWVTSRQIEAARRAMTHTMKREGKIWIRIFPHQAVTATPNETRMGGGKGSVSHYVATVKPGTVLFEIDGISAPMAKEAMRLASHKLPVRTRFITKH